ncbi:hypothetical protein KRMM14A1004_00290 [Krasilnikovia sp. MM14-A1004]
MSSAWHPGSFPPWIGAHKSEVRSGRHTLSALWDLYVTWLTNLLTWAVVTSYVARMKRSKRLTRRRFVDFLRVCTCTC